ncbi:PREDICTED: uncharacterized protein LOC109217490 [Nicotiana attenuata]|uniref:uncharacterized protein LOC109217490 n=1 Tax=Nicotiana attenuata TaxID=49451 RepID=UPI000905B2E5|nr:PREDICTED: uncharacterized protein LOC109217490 [Nicotiana attenuata]
MASNTRMALNRTTIMTANAFQILQQEEGRREEPRPPDIGGGIIRKQNGIHFYCTVVYGHNDAEQRRRLWDHIRGMAKNITGPWLLGEDFNAILNVQDRMSKTPVKNADIKELAELCQDIGITEIPWRGDYFTWTNKQEGDDRVWSRIDRLFGNDLWMMNYSHLSTEYGEPYISDHNPMIVNMRQPRKLYNSPFRFFNIWASHPDFDRIIREEWTNGQSTGKMVSIWIKLKRLKSQFRILNTTEFKGVNDKIEQARQAIQQIQSQMQNSYSDLLQGQEKEWLHKLETWSMVEEQILQQKARATWIKLGDSNNKFFSAVIKERQQRKQIEELQAIAGGNLTTQAAIKEEIIVFYKSLMGTRAQVLPAVDKMIMKEGPTLTQQQQEELIAEVTHQEIDQALKGIGGDKAPGIDGYSAISGRKIADNIILAHELVKSYNRKQISPRCMLKVDMMKAYDSVEWVYLDQLLEYLCFPTKFNNWVRACVTTVSYSIMINRELTKPFDAAKGLRQGDPISPFLFAIAMEYLSRLLKGLKHVKDYKIHPRCGKLNITHLSFADDLLMFTRGDSKSVNILHACFMKFSAASGLLANLNKSAIYFGGVSHITRQEILQNTGYSEGQLPFKYLGIPLDTKKLSAMQWSYIWSGSNVITKRTLIAWDKMCLPKSAGGYNLLNLRVWNKAAITSVYWDLVQKKDKMWIKWIHIYYIKGQRLMEMNIPQQAS